MHPWQMNKKHHNTIPSSKGTLWAKTKASLPALGPHLATIKLDGVKPDKASGDIVDCKYLASYTLLEGLQKVILVPGRPQKWTPLQEPTSLNPDRGEYWRDENAARFPQYTMTPTVASIFHMNPSFDSASIDIVTCASVLGSILRFCMGASQPQSFVVQMIGNTAFFLRRNKSPDEKIEGVRGHGHTFLETYTTYGGDVCGSASHQRIIKYSLGCLQLLVRSEVDAYDPDMCTGTIRNQGSTVQPVETSRTTQNPISSTQNDDDVSRSGEERESSFPQQHDWHDDVGLTIRDRGSVVAQKSLIEIKTRSVHLEYDKVIDEQMPRMWLRQVPNFVMALHKNGLFQVPEPINIDTGMASWEAGSTLARSRMSSLLKLILETVWGVEGRKMEVRGEGPFAMEFHRLSEDEEKNWEALSETLKQKWISSDNGAKSVTKSE